ncbi:MAG: twin-arginine translocase TatA/TatE family subunit [Gammaproteobacteria bacterium]|jgi:sec-independent protein translocase protein TatA
MGLGGISPIQLLIIFGIVILIFGTAKLKNFGGDLGGAIKGFKKAMNEDEEPSKPSADDDAKQIETDGKPDAEFSEQAEKEKHN